ncbi:protein-glutamate O-methyltransferase CheR [Hyalangium sp.]|uniref:CheR family methyltransferase n=1 Tax=Hyalangium sp. TaxID=2028555 RepID=UPI002D64B6A1|nr:protein-glutamate O-methyltransferase CheR [Hyalangium sp.]HYI02499.1 protein-glutamate O-methyltransferase CheR [Hyalangium sp.]
MSQPPLPWSEAGYARIFERVQERAGFLPPTCVSATEDGIGRAMARTGLTDFALYLERIDSDPAALDVLISELTIGETYFFRTPEHFDFLSQRVLPELRRLHGPAHTLRVWSAGCASGEEPYSLAVVLLSEGFSDRMEVLATDISRAALDRAREARYGPWSLRGAEAARIQPYLRKEDGRFVLVPEVRQRVRFAILNLALDTWPSRETGIHDLDVIFCRNVFIYFTRPTIEAVARRLHESLADGGFLITGPSDPSLAGFSPFEPLLTKWGVAWRRTPPGSSQTPRPPPAFRPPAAPPPFLPSELPPLRPAPTPPPAPLPPPPSPSRAEPLPSAAPAADGLEPARQAMRRGDWQAAAQLAGAEDSPEAAAVAVRALANVDPAAAVRACAEAAAHHPLSVELRYLEAVLLLGQGRLGEAERAARQALYLEPSLAVAWLTLGHVLRRLGDAAGSLRAFQTTERLCAGLPPDEPLPLAEGERAGRLAAVARGERMRLEATEPREES